MDEAIKSLVELFVKEYDEVKKDVKQVWQDTMNNLDRLDEID